MILNYSFYKFPSAICITMLCVFRQANLEFSICFVGACSVLCLLHQFLFILGLLRQALGVYKLGAGKTEAYGAIMARQRANLWTSLREDCQQGG